MLISRAAGPCCKSSSAAARGRRAAVRLTAADGCAGSKRCKARSAEINVAVAARGCHLHVSGLRRPAEITADLLICTSRHRASTEHVLRILGAMDLRGPLTSRASHLKQIGKRKELTQAFDNIRRSSLRLQDAVKICTAQVPHPSVERRSLSLSLSLTHSLSLALCPP